MQTRSDVAAMFIALRKRFGHAVARKIWRYYKNRMDAESRSTA